MKWFIFVILLVVIAAPANAYIFKSSVDSTVTGGLTFGDGNDFTISIPFLDHSYPGNFFLLSCNPDWLPGENTSWAYSYRTMQSPSYWKFGLWTSPAWTCPEKVNVFFWIPRVGDEGPGSDITGTTWCFQNAITKELVWQGIVDETKNTSADPWFKVSLSIKSTSNPANEADAYVLYSVPEPSSLLALSGGLIGILGIIKRKKAC